MRPVRSRAQGLFNLDNIVESFNKYEVQSSRKSHSKRVQNRKLNQATIRESINIPKVNLNSSRKSKSKMNFEAKMEDGLYNQFDRKDWLMYWQYKAKQMGVNYIIMKGNYPKEYAILGSVMSNFSVEDTKLMIDFLWDCEHDIHERRTMGTWILSKGWINQVYQSALLWRDGKYKTRAQQRQESVKANQRNREWVSTEDKPQESKPKKKIRI